MRKQIEKALSKVADTARTGVNTAVDATQDRVGQAGKVVAQGKKPVQKVSKAGLAVNAITFRMSKELIELQSKTTQDSIDNVAKRLRDASRAESLRELLNQQRSILPGTASFYVENAKSAFSIVRGAASELGSVVTSFGKTPATKKAKTVAKKVARKKPVRKAKAKAKTVAKKVSSAVADAGQAS
ncbi:MAG: phasin family protein [Pseudomonadota bacterium]